jgi:hypothetical protein
MTKSTRLAAVACLLAGLLAAAPISRAQTPPNIGEQMAKTCGLDGFGQIEAIRFTFNAQVLGNNVSRSWVWWPKTGQISYEGKDKDGKPVKVTYVESQLDAAPPNVKETIEPAFANDKYNMVFPLQAYWDGAPFNDKGTQKLPIGEGSARLVEVSYSPGDVWDLYVGADSRVEAFVFHRGESGMKPSLAVATWGAYKKAGPLLIATDRRGTADGKPLRVWFTGLAVKLTGSDNWVSAQ